MALSYWLRTACLAGVSLGLLQAGCELILWFAAPALLRLLQRLPMRAQERALYFVQLLPFAVAAAFTGLCCLPRYIGNETNLSPERVGWLPLAVASLLAICWLGSLLRGARMLVATTRFSHELRRLHYGPQPKLAVLPVETTAPRVALVGLWRPFILISKSLTEAGGLDARALEVVLAHERAHARQHDNWKMLTLRCVPRLNMKLRGGRTWMQHWHSAAECAADHDAAAGSEHRALLLAETLVALARGRHALPSEIACTDFACHQQDLATRVEHLLHAPSPQTSSRSAGPLLALGIAALAVALAASNLSPALADLPEYLLHLG